MDPENTTIATCSTFPGRSTGHNNDKSSKDQRRPVRRDPEKRRQQNIQAQKKYREKVKKRLDHLEILAASLAPCTGAVPAATPSAGPSVAPSLGSSPSNTSANEYQGSPSDTSATQDQSSCQQTSPSNTSATEHQSSCQHLGQTLNDHSDESSLDFPDLTFSPFLTSASSDLTLWDPSISIDPSHLIHNKDTTDTTASESQYRFGGYVDCGCLKAHVQFSSSIPKEYRDLKVLNASPDLFSADPYLNTLRIERVCLAQAIFSNCLHIGITEDMFCDDDAVSPFFRPTSKNADDAGYDRMVKTIQGIYKTLKQDVRPIKEQITTMHSLFIDVLPFPTFRRNLIRSGDAVDEEELYEDLLNGLVCWGGAGVGRRDRDCSTGYTSTGTPWDGRSWEARTWFLQKYWALLGGEDGELVQQSEWWRNMRGDEASPWSGI